MSYTGEKEVLTSYSLSDADVRGLVLKDILCSPASTLDSAVSSDGARKLLMSVGHIYYSCKSWLNSTDFKSRMQKIESLEAFSQPGSENYLKCSRLYFELARDQLHLMLSLKPHLKTACDNINFFANIPLPGRFVAETRISRGGQYFRQLRRIFLNCIVKVSQRYEQQLKHADSKRSQRLMIGRLFNINRLLYVNREFSEEVAADKIVARINAFLDSMEAAFRDKDPTIFRMADQERSLIAQDKIRQSYFTPRLANELFTEIDAYLKILN